MTIRKNYASKADVKGGGRLESRKKTARRGLDKLRGTVTALTGKLMSFKVTGGATCATLWAVAQSAQSWSGPPAA
jgi:hypothetical protein